MKTVNVMVMLQMDIPIEGNELDNIQTALDFVNNGLARDCDVNYNTQLFVNSIDKSDITYPYTTGFEIGDSVEVPDPDNSDIHNHSFVGIIIDFRNGNAVVEDGDGDCFEIEVERLTLI